MPRIEVPGVFVFQDGAADFYLAGSKEGVPFASVENIDSLKESLAKIIAMSIQSEASALSKGKTTSSTMPAAERLKESEATFREHTRVLNEAIKQQNQFIQDEKETYEAATSLAKQQFGQGI